MNRCASIKSGTGQKYVDRRQRGFTLIEIAIVLMVLGILLGYTVAMFPRQQELKQYRAVEAEMETIIEHLIAFAQVNGRLPCPDTQAATLDGREDALGPVGAPNDCAAFFGFVPGLTLGIDGFYGANNVLSDPWRTGYGYAVSSIGGAGSRTLVTANGIRTAGMNNVTPDLYLCDDNVTPPANDTDCTTVSGGDVLGANGEVAAVIISLGRDNAVPATSNIQTENQDDFDSGLSDKVYIYAPPRDDYDDRVSWLSTRRLFMKMIEAEQLP